MKRVISLIFALVFALALCACGAAESIPETVPTTQPPVEESTVAPTEETIPEVTLPENAILCVRTETDNGIEITGDGLSIVLDNNRQLTITVSGLDIKDSYMTNLADSHQNMCEYCWAFTFHDDMVMKISTITFADSPGMQNYKTLNDMQTDIFYREEYDAGKFASRALQVPDASGRISYVNVTLSHTPDSITWKCILPEEYISMTWDELDAAIESGSPFTTSPLPVDLKTINQFEMQIQNEPEQIYETRNYFVQ